jgi:hypothetical protein
MGAALTKDAWEKIKLSLKEGEKFCDLKNVRMKIKAF